MANSYTVSAGDDILAADHNTLREDVLNVTTGHRHSGLSEDGQAIIGPTLTASGLSFGTNYQAATDVFVLVCIRGVSGNNTVKGYQGTSNPAANQVIASHSTGTAEGGFCMPVAQGHWWRCDLIAGGAGSFDLRILKIGA